MATPASVVHAAVALVNDQAGGGPASAPGDWAAGGEGP
jgi:hypothetical protein